jgi:hypothetical protein
MSTSHILHLLHKDALTLGEDSLPLILTEIDDFVTFSQGNKRIKSLSLYVYSFNEDFTVEQDEHTWERIGEAFGNLQSLKTIYICDDANAENYKDWERLASILRHVRQSVKIRIDAPYRWFTREMQLFLQAIHGHPTITGFEVGDSTFPYESMGGVIFGVGNAANSGIG